MDRYAVPFAAFGGLGFGGTSFLLSLHHYKILKGHRSDIDKLKTDLAQLIARIDGLGIGTITGEKNAIKQLLRRTKIMFLYINTTISIYQF